MQDSTTNNAAAQVDQIIKQALNAWKAQNKAVTNFFSKYEDDVYLNEVAPGRNRAIYLLGHLVAVNDGLLPLFGLGDKLFPELEAMFLASPDKTIVEIPSLAELKNHWEVINTKLTEHFDNMQASEWLDRHTKVSPEDFAADPLRNKLNVLMGRTIHQSYHAGQLALLTNKELVA